MSESAQSTPGQRWRARRDQVIRTVYATGIFSQRELADVFDLGQSRVGEVLAAAGNRPGVPQSLVSATT